MDSPRPDPPYSCKEEKKKDKLMLFHHIYTHSRSYSCLPFFSFSLLPLSSLPLSPLRHTLDVLLLACEKRLKILACSLASIPIPESTTFIVNTQGIVSFSDPENQKEERIRKKNRAKLRVVVPPCCDDPCSSVVECVSFITLSSFSLGTSYESHKKKREK